MNKVVKLSPVVKSYIWGGQYFQKYGKSDLDVVSELWELSVRDNEKSIIVSGKEQGKALKDVITDKDIGTRGKEFPYFPLLIKLIDAKENLSVQVHPSDEYALKNEHSFGKCEMWYIIDADEGAGLYVGLNKDYSKDEIETKVALCSDGNISFSFASVLICMASSANDDINPPSIMISTIPVCSKITPAITPSVHTIKI